MTDKFIETDIFVEKNNAYLTNGEPDDECWQAKNGMYQYRITTTHFKTKEEAFETLEMIRKLLKENTK